MSKEAVVVASSRTGLAKSFRGSMNMTRPDDMAAHVIKDVLAKVPDLDPAEIEDVILGCANPSGAAGNNMARMTERQTDTLLAGIDAEDGAACHLSTDRWC